MFQVPKIFVDNYPYVVSSVGDCRCAHRLKDHFSTDKLELFSASHTVNSRKKTVKTFRCAECKKAPFLSHCFCAKKFHPRMEFHDQGNKCGTCARLHCYPDHLERLYEPFQDQLPKSKAKPKAATAIPSNNDVPPPSNDCARSASSTSSSPTAKAARVKPVTMGTYKRAEQRRNYVKRWMDTNARYEYVLQELEEQALLYEDSVQRMCSHPKFTVQPSRIRQFIEVNTGYTPMEVAAACDKWKIDPWKMFAALLVLHKSDTTAQVHLLQSLMANEKFCVSTVDNWIFEVFQKVPQERYSKPELRFKYRDKFLPRMVTCIIDGVPFYCRGGAHDYNAKNHGKHRTFQVVVTLTGRPIAWSRYFPGCTHDANAAHRWKMFPRHKKWELVLADTAYLANCHCMGPEKGFDTDSFRKTKRKMLSKTFATRLAAILKEKGLQRLRSDHPSVVEATKELKAADKKKIKTLRKRSSYLEGVIRSARARVEHFFAKVNRHDSKKYSARSPGFTCAMFNMCMHMEALRYDLRVHEHGLTDKEYVSRIIERDEEELENDPHVGEKAPECTCKWRSYAHKRRKNKTKAKCSKERFGLRVRTAFKKTIYENDDDLSDVYTDDESTDSDEDIVKAMPQLEDNIFRMEALATKPSANARYERYTSPIHVGDLSHERGQDRLAVRVLGTNLDDTNLKGVNLEVESWEKAAAADRLDIKKLLAKSFVKMMLKRRRKNLEEISWKKQHRYFWKRKRKLYRNLEDERIAEFDEEEEEVEEQEEEVEEEADEDTENESYKEMKNEDDSDSSCDIFSDEISSDDGNEPAPKVQPKKTGAQRRKR